MGNSKYPLLLGAQIGMLVTDVAFNAAAVLLFGNSIVLLMMYILQDTLILLSVIVLVIAFSSTFVSAGLIFLLFRRFASTLIAAFVYLGLSITLHCVTLNNRWERSTTSIFFTPPILVLYIAHKCCAVVHYAMYKRAVLLLVDPKYHGDSEWLRSKIRESG
ncbi:hypothetical protein COOONC_19524 [Cooperia oncophora]